MGKNEIDAKKLSYSWFKSLDDHTIFYAGLNFVFRNLLDSAAGGTFMEINLGEATTFLDNIMANYSQWHTERAPTSKKVNSVEEISFLSEKVDTLMRLVASKSAPLDFNDMPLFYFH